MANEGNARRHLFPEHVIANEGNARRHLLPEHLIANEGNARRSLLLERGKIMRDVHEDPFYQSTL